MKIHLPKRIIHAIAKQRATHNRTYWVKIAPNGLLWDGCIGNHHGFMAYCGPSRHKKLRGGFKL